MIKHIRVLMGALLLFGLTFSAQAQRARWDYLGEANVDGRADHDVIRVGRSDGRFRAIQLRVEKGEIEFDRVVVHYQNGQSEPIEIRSRIKSGGMTRAIDLPGDRRVIEGVEIFYRQGRWGDRRPRVRLFGIR